MGPHPSSGLGIRAPTDECSTLLHVSYAPLVARFICTDVNLSSPFSLCALVCSKSRCESLNSRTSGPQTGSSVCVPQTKHVVQILGARSAHAGGQTCTWVKESGLAQRRADPMPREQSRCVIDNPIFVYRRLPSGQVIGIRCCWQL